MITKIGKKAKVVVLPEEGVRKAKFASAHDLRRAFGFRWRRSAITIAELKELMRHSDIETTLTYYVGQDAKSTSARLWGLCGTEKVQTQKP